MMAFFLCIFSVVSNWNYNELEPSFIWYIMLCPPTCKVLFQKWRKRVYIIVITQINKRVELLPHLRWWNGLLIIKFCGKLLPWYKHVYVFQELYPSYLCTCTYTHICTLSVCWQACERLLAYRVEMKVKTKKVDGILNRLHVAMPALRDEKARPPCIPGERQSC